VVLATGEQMGVMSSRDAYLKAQSLGLDLVEIAPNAEPPVCKIVDYGKWKYEQAKLKKNQKSKSATRLKEVKFRVRTEPHDYNIKMARAEKFLDTGHKVRVQLQFRGRENAHKELGFVVMKRVIEDLKTMAQLDQEPRLSGRAIGMTLSPLPQHKRKPRFTKFHDEDYIDEDDEEQEDHDDGPDDAGPDDATGDGAPLVGEVPAASDAVPQE